MARLTHNGLWPPARETTWVVTSKSSPPWLWGWQLWFGSEQGLTRKSFAQTEFSGDEFAKVILRLEPLPCG